LKARELLWRIAVLTPEDVEPRLALAWLLATCRQDDVRDGAGAVRLVEQIKAGGELSLIAMLNARGAAYAEVGRFDEAVESSRRALLLARRGGNERLVGQIETRIQAYRDRQPLRAPPRRLSIGLPR
jgi:hypothetical protein